MEKISIFTVTLVWLLCSDVHGVVSCSFDYYYKPGQGCVACPPCPAGQEITNNCGYDKNGVQTGDSCKNCTVGVSYNDEKTRGSCKNCHDCIGMGKIEIKACTLNSNAVCACPKGFYETGDGQCEECSFCCGSNWEQSKNIVPECRNQGLGRCICRPSWECSGKCSAPTTTPKSTTSAPKTTPKMTMPASESKPTISAQTSSSRIEGPKNNTTQIPSATVTRFKQSEYNQENDPNAAKEEKEKSFGAFFKTGWIVLFCLLGVIIVLVAVAVCHERTRKQISGRCCRKYGALATYGDHDVTSVLVEGHHVEQAAGDTTNNATPIPPWEEPVPPFLQSSSTAEEMYCSCRTEKTGYEQMQCACTMNTSETSLEAHSSSSAETISEELQHYCYKRRQKRQQSSPVSSSRVSSPESDHYLVRSNSPSNGVTTSPSHRRSPDRYGVTYSPPSACVTSSLPRMQSPDRFGETSSSNSTCGTPSPPCRRSPEHRCITPSSHSSCGTSVPPRGRSPDPLSLSSFPNHSSFSDDHESCNQTDEYTQRSESLSVPISVEAFDKGHEPDASKATRKKAPSAQVTRNEGHFVGGRKSPNGKKGVTDVCTGELRLEELWPQNETGTDKDKGIPLTPVSDGGADRVVITTSGNDIRAGEIGCLVIKANVAVNPPCKYRRIQRNEEHRCPECCPQPEDSFFQLIDRERLCLKEEICKELNRSYKDLAIFARVDKEIEEYEASPKPAECVLKKIKDSVPTITLKDFEEMLRGIKRLDVAQLIQDHHFSCTFCQRNRFDSNA